MGAFDFYDQVIGASIYGSGKYFQEGKYVMVIQEVKIIDSQRKKGVKFLIVPCTVQESTADNAKPGDTVTWRVDMSNVSGPSNMKQFCLAVGESLFDGFQEEHINHEFLDKLLGDDQIAEDLVIRAEAFNVKTRDGGDFTKVIWAPDQD